MRMDETKRSRSFTGTGIERESMKFLIRQQQQQQQQQQLNHSERCCWKIDSCVDHNNKRNTKDAGLVVDPHQDPFGSRGEPTSGLREWLPCLIPSVLAVGVYSNSLGGDFVHDDLSAITGNRDITDPTAGTWDFLYNDFWGTSLLDPRSHKSYRPLTILTFKWNYAVSGLNPWSYHAVNVLLHATVSALFAWLCRNCLGLSKLSSLLAASLFAIHPIHTEAVSGIVGRADILTTLFFLLSFISHDRATISHSRHTSSSSSTRASLHSTTCFSVWMLRVASLLSALLALAAKENGIAALPVAITWDIIRLHQRSVSSQRCSHVTNHNQTSNTGSAKSCPFTSRCPNSRLASRWSGCRTWLLRPIFKSWPIILSIVTTIVLLVARIALQQGQLPLFSEQDNPAAFASSRKARILTMLYLPAFNMGLLLAPVLLSYDWQNGSIPLVEDWRDWRNAGTFIFYTSLAVALVYSWLNRKKVILWSAAVMVWPMLPASNLFYPCGFVVAERLLYLPSLGYCLIVAVGLPIVFRSTFSRWTVVRSGRPVCHYRPTGSYASLRRRSSSSSSTCSSLSTTSSTSRSSSSSSRHGRHQSKWKLLADCLPLVGAVLLAVTLTTKTWTRNADWADRRTLFESGLRTLPNNAKMHYNYANVQKDDGRWEAAIDHYRQAIELWPNYASALNNLGTVLLARADEMDDSDRHKETTVMEAERRFRDAIRSHPHHAHAHYNLAILYLQRNETGQALYLLKRCLNLNPQHREAVHLLHWIQVEDQNGSNNMDDDRPPDDDLTDDDEIVVASMAATSSRTRASGIASIGHLRNGEKSSKTTKTIGSFSPTHPSTATPPQAGGYWITANRLQPQPPPTQPQREESLRRGGSTNLRWNKTAKN